MLINEAPPTDCLQQRTVLITGASGGLGSALAKAAAGCGATVILSGRNVPALEKLYDAIEASGAPQPAIYPVNFHTATEHDYQAMANTLAEEFGVIHGLVHCAVDAGAPTLVREYPVDIWTRVMTVNFTSGFLLTRTLLPLLDRSHHASVIYVSDPKTSAYWGAYGASKAAQQSMASILADEIEGMVNEQGHPRVCVNTVDPGPMRTRLRSLLFAGELPTETPLPETRTNAFVHLLARTDVTRHGSHLQLDPATSDES